MSSSAFHNALSVFAQGYAFTRSFTHPYEIHPLSPQVTILRDAPRRRGPYRNEEVIASGVAVETLVSQLATETRGRFRVCYVLPTGEPDTELRATFKALGYRLNATEQLMQHTLGPLSPATAPYPIERVTTAARAQRLARSSGRRQLLPEHLDTKKPPIRFYVALEGEAPCGWVGSITAGNDTYCTNMFVEPGYRRQGIARALLTRMLNDDRAAGARVNILLASHTGSKLYPTVGYETLGTLYLYTPPRNWQT